MKGILRELHVLVIELISLPEGKRVECNDWKEEKVRQLVISVAV